MSLDKKHLVPSRGEWSKSELHYLEYFEGSHNTFSCYIPSNSYQSFLRQNPCVSCRCDEQKAGVSKISLSSWAAHSFRLCSVCVTKRNEKKQWVCLAAVGVYPSLNTWGVRTPWHPHRFMPVLWGSLWVLSAKIFRIGQVWVELQGFVAEIIQLFLISPNEHTRSFTGRDDTGEKS